MSAEQAQALTVREFLTVMSDLELHGADGESVTLELFEKLEGELLDLSLEMAPVQYRRHLFIGSVLILCRCFRFSGMVASVAIVDALTEALQATLPRAPETLAPFIHELTLLAVREFLEDEAADTDDDDSTHH